MSRAALFFFASLLVVDLYIVGNWFGVEEVVERLQGTSLASEKRDEVAIDTLLMWREHLWTGTGADTFFEAYVYGGFMSADSLYYRHAHNDYLEFGTGYGLVGFVLLAFIVVYSLWQAVMAQRERRSRLLKGLGFGSMMAIVSLLIHSSVDFNLQVPANALWFVVLLGFAWIARYGRLV